MLVVVHGLATSACAEPKQDEGPALRFVQAIHGAPDEAVDVYARVSGQLTWPEHPIVSELRLADTAWVTLEAIEGENPTEGAATGEDAGLDVVVLRSGQHPDTTLYTAASFGLPWPDDAETTQLLVAHRPNVAGTPPLLHASDAFTRGDGRIAAFGGCQWLDAPIELRADDGRRLVSGLDWQDFVIATNPTPSTQAISWIEAEDEAGQGVRFVPSTPLQGDDLGFVLVDDVVNERCLLVVTDWARGERERLSPAP